MPRLLVAVLTALLLLAPAAHAADTGPCTQAATSGMVAAVGVQRRKAALSSAA